MYFSYHVAREMQCIALVFDPTQRTVIVLIADLHLARQRRDRVIILQL
jgi:ABC-type enterochelin transport system ATPase subunit